MTGKTPWRISLPCLILDLSPELLLSSKLAPYEQLLGGGGLPCARNLITE